MKKAFVLSLAAVMLFTCVFAACSNDKNAGEDGYNLESGENEYGFEIDEDGNEVPVIYKKDKDGNTIAVPIDNEGNPIKDENGKEVTVKTTYEIGKQTTSPQDTTEADTQKLTTTTTEKPTGTTQKDVPNTSSADTTEFDDTEVVPKTSATGKKVNFSPEDQATIKSMLEVPYLYLANYENSDGVPISIACHTAVWMAERKGGNKAVLPKSPVVLNLFYYYGQTVVNFTTQCNEYAKDSNAPIRYNSKNDTFEISEYTSRKQVVSINSIEDLGNSNFYKVTGSVSNCNKKKVVAIIQKNKLDTTLGFSVKALKWS